MKSVYVILYRKGDEQECYKNKIYSSYEKAIEDYEDEYMDQDKNWGIYEANLVIKEPKL